MNPQVDEGWGCGTLAGSRAGGGEGEAAASRRFPGQLLFGRRVERRCSGASLSLRHWAFHSRSPRKLFASEALCCLCNTYQYGLPSPYGMDVENIK